MATFRLNDPFTMGGSARSRRAARYMPASWPFVIKLSFALLVAGLLPMAVVTAWNLHHALRTAEQTEFRHLQAVAHSTSARIDQLVRDTQSTVAFLAAAPEIVSLMAAGPDQRPTLQQAAQNTIEGVVRADPDVFSVLLMDTRGTCIASTRQENVGVDLSFREYFRDAIQGRPHISEVLSGAVSMRPGVFLSSPVRSAIGTTVGVAVVKLKAESLAEMVEVAHAATGLHGALIDRYGVVVISSDPNLLYHSLRPLPDDVLQSQVFVRRFNSAGVKDIKSLGWNALAERAVGATSPGHISFQDPKDGTTRFAGFAPVQGRGWSLAMIEPDVAFMAPLRARVRGTLISTAILSAAIVILSVMLARNITRPLAKLTAAARELRRGHFDRAHVEFDAHDEIGVLARTFNSVASSLAERERERDIFGRVVSPEVREKLLAGELGLGGETRYVAVLFSDIRGFSTMSEKMDPQDVVAMLNEYLAAMTSAVRPWHGYVNNFIGDAIVVIFGAPVGASDVEVRAARASLDMRAALATLNRRRLAEGHIELRTGIGISAGKVVAGQIGSLERMLYTVIGDAVNVAARLESETKGFPEHPILMTGRVANALRDASDLHMTSIGLRHVKGRDEPVEMWALHAPGDVETSAESYD